MGFEHSRGKAVLCSRNPPTSPRPQRFPFAFQTVAIFIRIGPAFKSAQHFQDRARPDMTELDVAAIVRYPRSGTIVLRAVLVVSTAGAWNAGQYFDYGGLMPPLAMELQRGKRGTAAPFWVWQCLRFRQRFAWRPRLVQRRPTRGPAAVGPRVDRGRVRGDSVTGPSVNNCGAGASVPAGGRDPEARIRRAPGPGFPPGRGIPDARWSACVVWPATVARSSWCLSSS